MESDDTKFYDSKNSTDSQVDSGFLFNICSVSKSEPSTPIGLPVVSKRDDLYYSMDRPKQGRCIILNYESFDSDELNRRRGTHNDVQKLYSTFKKLDFIVQPYNDLTLQKTMDILKQESLIDHTPFNCFVLCILTHGSNGILHTKDKKFDTNKMFEHFTGSRCKSLVGKPKLFFIQACQGEMFDSGVLVHDSPLGPSNYFTVPNFADFLIFYSTFPGHYSWRNVENGSWFIQTLCEVLDQYSGKYDLMTLLTIVCQKVAINFESRVPNNPAMHKKKQIPCIMSTLTRLVSF